MSLRLSLLQLYKITDLDIVFWLREGERGRERTETSTWPCQSRWQYRIGLDATKQGHHGAPSQTAVPGAVGTAQETWVLAKPAGVPGLDLQQHIAWGGLQSLHSRTQLSTHSAVHYLVLDYSLYMHGPHMPAQLHAHTQMHMFAQTYKCKNKMP